VEKSFSSKYRRVYVFLHPRRISMAQAPAQRKPVQSADSDLSQLFKEFHSRHRDAAGNKLQFTAVFNTFLDSMIDNPKLDMVWRAIIWVVRMAWGYDSDFAVKTFEGAAVSFADFGRRVDIDRRRASEIFVLAAATKYLSIQDGLLYPTDQPAQTAKSNKKSHLSDEGRVFPDTIDCPVNLSSSPVNLPSPYLLWCLSWKRAYPTDNAELEAAEATVKRIKFVRLGLYRQAQRTGQPATPIIIDKTSTTIKSASSSCSAGLSTEPAPEEPTTTTSPIETPQEPPEPTQEAQFHQEVKQAFVGKGSPTPEQLRKAYAAVPRAAPVATFVEYLKRRMPQLKHPGGLQSVANEFAREWHTCGGTVEAWNAQRLARGPIDVFALMIEREKAKSGGVS
jgi:hypothetical protein